MIHVPIAGKDCPESFWSASSVNSAKKVVQVNKTSKMHLLHQNRMENTKIKSSNRVLTLHRLIKKSKQIIFKYQKQQIKWKKDKKMVKILYKSID